ncbi:hypothetical protein WJX72_001170 [[Myrmecia] bisecta]|uniref:ethanolamine kinase n=1 Tax=[Myrmecia] bisecta TaxID=41462 RepID=A0AAW1PSD1_9CHLO
MVHKVSAPHRRRTLDLQQAESELHFNARQLAKELLVGWAALGEDDIEIGTVSGGITNVLWQLAPPQGSELERVLLRVFGDKTDLLIDRDRELEVVLQLNAAGFGANVIATFENGRFESFIPMRTLKPEQMTQPDMAVCIARRLRQFHAVDITGDKQPTSFATTRKWLDMARSLDFEDSPAKQAQYEALDFDQMSAEMSEIEEACLRIDSPSVFSHHDLLSGNVMVSWQEDEPVCSAVDGSTVQFIDFEYGAYSQRGFDLGNHFNEYAGFECDYGRYPSKGHVADFARSYLAEGQSTPPEERAVQQLAVEANVFALASHQYWGVWAILQSRYSPIDFDYMGYSQLRWSEYYRRKAEFLADLGRFLEQAK